MKLLVFDAWPGESVTCGSGLGSSLLKLPSFADARAAGHSVDVLTSPPKVELLAHAPAVGRCFGSPDEVAWGAYDRLVPFGVPGPALLREDPRLHADPRSDARLKADYDQVSHVRFWRCQMADALGGPPPQTPALMSVAPSAAGLAWARARLPQGRTLVTLSLSALTNLKRYLSWADVARGLESLLPDACLALVGQEPPGAGFPASVLDLTQGTTLEQLVAVVASSDVVVGTDGLITNLGVACGRPTVVLFTVIRPEFVVDRDLELGASVRSLVHSGCPLQPCYELLGDYRAAPCPLDPALGPIAAPRCAGFDPAEVVTAVAALVGEDAQVRIQGLVPVDE